MILYHGVLIVPVAVIGAVIGLRRRDPLAILAVVWWVMVLEFSSLGVIETLVPGSESWLMRYDYPFSIAWHGPILPYTILGGMALLWAWEKWGAARLGNWLHQHSWKLLLAACLIPALILVFNRELLALSKGRLGIFGTFSSAADVQAMEWLKVNTPPDARVLNFPGSQFDNSHEADWVPVISERESVYFRWQPFFRGTEAVLAEQDRLRAFWLPAGLLVQPGRPGSCRSAARGGDRLRDRAAVGDRSGEHGNHVPLAHPLHRPDRDAVISGRCGLP